VLGLELASMAAFLRAGADRELAILCAARRWLHSVGYVAAIAAIALLEVLLSWRCRWRRRRCCRARRAPVRPRGAPHALRDRVPDRVLRPARARARPAIAEARIQALQARIRPHFLYNSINAVLSLIRSSRGARSGRSRTWPTSSAC
jgi:two-component system sensor histidine kinase AlgZ